MLSFSHTTTLSTLLIFPGILILAPDSTQLVHSSKANLDTLRQAQILFRHGARSIDETYPTDSLYNESFWSPGYSQLTNRGKLQAYNLGLFLRQRYNGFVKDTYTLKDIYVLSSDFARTMQTANSVLAGFYLPNRISFGENQTAEDYLRDNSVELPLPWKSVPVHTVPVEYDNIIRQQPSNCPRYSYLLSNIIQDEAEVNRVFEENRDIMDYVSSNAGVHGATKVLRTLDTLLLERYYNMTLASWTDKLFETEKASNFFYFYFQMMTFTEEMKRLRNGPLLQRLVDNMVMNTSSMDHFTRARSGQKKMYLFAGHDSTIANLLNTLGIFNKRRPPFTAAVMVELHQNQNEMDSGDTRQGLYVEIHYRNETDRDPYPLQIPGCALQCPLADFLSLTKPYIPLDWNLECQLAEAPSGGLSIGWILLIILGFWVVLFILMQCWIRTKCFDYLKARERKKAYTNIP